MRDYWIAIFGLIVGFSWGFIIFYITPSDKIEIKREGAKAVYENRAKCEKAMGEWICKFGDFKDGPHA